jgi:hypothetical protein
MLRKSVSVSSLNQANRTSIVNFENRWLHKDGSYRCLGWRVSLGEEGLLYGIAREISPINPELQQLQVELKQAQEELRRSEEHFAKAFRANLIPAVLLHHKRDDSEMSTTASSAFWLLQGRIDWLYG